MKLNQMFVFIFIAAAMTLSALTVGCAVQEAVPSESESESSQTPSTLESALTESAPEAMSQELKSLCEEQMYRLLFDYTLFNDWNGTPVPPNEPPMSANFVLTDVSKTGNIITVTAELYGNICIDPVSLDETIEYGMVRIVADEGPYAPQLAFGKSVVRFQKSGGGLSPLSCEYERYPHPGLDYLKSRTEKLGPVLSESDKLDVSKYDKLLVDYIWQVLCAHRYIEKPEDITLYDLENLRDAIEMPLGSIYADDYVDMYSPDYSMDASLLRLMPNLESIYCSYRLKDYGVFENMQSLKKLTLCQANDEMLRTLKVGHTDEFMLQDPDFDMFDMTNINTEVLRLNSWSTAVRGFTGCDKIEKLYIMSTRTDMRLVNAETFPNASYLNLYFYSAPPRVRDFSQLASFGDDVKIDLYLDYQACNNETLESLQDVKLNDLYLNPENGSYPLQDLDHSLIEKLNAQNITFGMEMYFQERTGD